MEMVVKWMRYSGCNTYFLANLTILISDHSHADCNAEPLHAMYGKLKGKYNR